jgi:hypothetical protein
MARGRSRHSTGTLAISLGSLLPLGSTKRDGFWCDLRERGGAVRGEAPLRLSSTESLAGADWIDLTWSGGVSLRFGHRRGGDE